MQSTGLKKQKRLPIYKRDDKNISGIRIQTRDIEILKLVHDYRFINSDQIKALCWGSEQVILRRLWKLFHHGYLDRPKQQIRYGIEGSEPMIYAITNKGANLLKKELGTERKKVDFKVKNFEVGDRHIFHTTMISQIRAAVTLAAKGHPDINFLFWQSEGKFTDCTILKKNGKNLRIPIVPDGFFGIKYGDKKLYFFIEADRSTMTGKRILKKMKGYWNYWKEGGLAKEAKIENFRVLTIAKTDKRKNNLCKITKKADEKQKGSSLFWFACVKQISLETPGDFFFANIWNTAKEDKFSRLLKPDTRTRKGKTINLKDVETIKEMLFENI